MVWILVVTGQLIAAGDEPLIVAHRGLLRHAPENTLANFRACLELRLGFEFDVQRTKDGQLLCIHDGSVDRTTDGTGRVADLTLAQVQELDAGAWFDPKFAGARVPSVDEVLKLVAEYGRDEVLIAVDIKAENVEQELVRLAERYRILNRLLFIGLPISNSRSRDRIKRASPQARTAAVANDSDEFVEALGASGADWVYVRFLPTKEQMEQVHQAGKRALIAGPTVSGHSALNWQQAVEAGIDAILTDFPLELRAMLKQKAK